MRTLFKGVAVAAALAAATTGLASTASALPAGTAPNGTFSLSPNTGAAATDFTMTPPTGAACAGDTSANSYKWSTFIVPRTTDPATLTWSSTGPVGFTPMFSNTGSAQVAKNTAVTTGLLTPIPVFNWGTHVPVAGQYYVGYACYNTGGAVVIGGNNVPVNTTTNFWSAPITVNATGSWINGNGAAPSAPVEASPLTAGDGTLSGTFTEAASIPDVTGFTVTATPASGPVVTSNLPATATSFSLSGLVNGTSYAVTVTATNSIGSATSTAVNGTPNPAPYASPTAFVATPGAGTVGLTWVAPAGDSGRTGYSLVISSSTSGAAGTGTFPIGAAATSYTATGLTPGDVYSFALTATYSAPYSGGTATLNATPSSAQVVIQDVTVVRPTGALVLTQVCGAMGGMPLRAATANFPVKVKATTDVLTGTAPTLDDGTGKPTATPDPRFGNVLDANGNPVNGYPFPTVTDTDPASATFGQQIPAANYPTHCGLNLGEAKLITKDQVNGTLGAGANLAGQYFTASGQINQLTVVDTRDIDAGWTVNATMSAFTTGTGGAHKSFGGNHLGWNPWVSHFSGNTFGEYGMSVTKGSNVEPMGPGLGTSQTLASAGTGAGLGMAQLDAQVELLIPVWVIHGQYSGTLTFTAL